MTPRIPVVEDDELIDIEPSALLARVVSRVTPQHELTHNADTDVYTCTCGTTAPTGGIGEHIYIVVNTLYRAYFHRRDSLRNLREAERSATLALVVLDGNIDEVDR